MNDIGSLWGRWDLQVQTIIDDDYVSLDSYYTDLKTKYPDKWDEFIGKVGGEANALLFDSKTYFNDDAVDLKERCVNYSRNLIEFVGVFQPSLCAAMVTDHNYDHALLIDELVKYSSGSKEKLQVIPGVEINVGGVHLLVGFGKMPFRKTTYSDGIASFLNKINVNSRKGDDGEYFVTQKDITEVIDIVYSNGGIIIFPHCNSDNGLFQERQKTDRSNLASIFNHKKCNILQAHSKESADIISEYINNNNNLKVDYCMTIAPDSRRLVDIGSSDEKGNYQWIKAKASFNGLQEIIVEPVDRTYIGKIPEKLVSIESHKGGYIKSIRIEHNPKDSESWFDQELELNPGLIAIIGKKGSGKSALTDIIGLAGDTHIDPKKFSFLVQKKFLRNAEACKYAYNLVWQDGSSKKGLLSDKVDIDKNLERVKYLPQSYVESICGEYGTSVGFKEEIDSVIFSYVPLEKRLSRSNLGDLLEYKDGAIEKNIYGLILMLKDQNLIIQKLEQKRKDDYRANLDGQIEQKKKDLNNLVAPIVATKPKKSGKTNKEIIGLNVKIEVLDKEIIAKEAELSTLRSKEAGIGLIESQINNFKEDFNNLEATLKDDLNKFGIVFSDVVKLIIEDDAILKQKRKLIKAREELEKQLNKIPNPTGTVKSLVENRDAMVTERDKKKGDLSKDETEYQDYLEAKKKYDERRAQIIGKEGDKGLATIKSIEAEIDYLKNDIDGDIDDGYKKRNEIVTKVFDKKIEKIEYYEEIYQPLISVLEHEREIQEKADSVLEVKVEPVFDRQKFVDKFETFIDYRAKGSFKGKSDGLAQLNKILDAHDLKSVEDVFSMSNEILTLFNIDSSSGVEVKIDIDSQLNISRAELYDFLFGISYIEVKYNLRFNGKELNQDQFSPGEKGAMLLIFYLLIEKGRMPLVIDQPEENLDNESVFELLVPYILQAKKERQVILVTHNPNLAVVCDAEQIICAEMDKKKNTIRYLSGGLEDYDINQRVSDILEGTLPAFDIRNTKYYRK